MKLSEIILIGVVFFFVIGAALGTCCGGPPVPPAVSVDVDASAQLAIEEEAPVLPDDFAKNDPPRISAEWLEFIPPEVVKDDGDSGKSTGKAGQKTPTLFTTDGTWPCGACDIQARNLSAAKPKFAFTTIPVPAAGPSPSGACPCWVAPDGTEFSGYMDTKTLEKWVKDHTPTEGKEVSEASGEEVNDELKGLSIVTIDASSSSAVIAAIAAHSARFQDKQTSKAIGWLPEIDVDLSDPMLKVLDGLLSKDGMTFGGGRISWPAGKRIVSFDPPIDVSYRKVLEVSVAVKAIEVNGREVVVRMGGRLIPDLKVILK